MAQPQGDGGVIDAVDEVGHGGGLHRQWGTAPGGLHADPEEAGWKTEESLMAVRDKESRILA